MNDFLLYDLKGAAVLVAFMALYRLLLARETYHRLNRVVLLSAAWLSLLLPLCVITTHETVVVELASELSTPAAPSPLPPALPAADAPRTHWSQWLAAVFLAGGALWLLRWAVATLRVAVLIGQSERHPQADGTVIAVTAKRVAPFSWMHFVVLSRDDYARQDPAILAHERGHIVRRHSLDVLFIDLLTCLWWWNPALWLLRRDLRDLHEYEADQAVLSQGIDARQYQYLLVRKAAGFGGYSVANGISNHSTLKNRINMMLRNKSSRSSRLKPLLLVPVVVAALALNARTVTDFEYTTPQKQKTLVKKGKKNSSVQLAGKDLKIVEQEPQAPVGDAPASPQKANEQDSKDRPVIVVKGDVCSAVDGKLEPLPGALVVVEGADHQGTVTDRDGKFSLEVKSGSHVSIQYVGMKTQNITVEPWKGNTEPQTWMIELLPEGEEKVWDVVEQMPMFEGGRQGLMNYLSANLRYPREAVEAGLQGRVIVSFVVEKDGQVSNAVVRVSADPALSAEALRLINNMPRWTPGQQDGKPVRTRYTVPVTFRLNDGNSVKTTIALNSNKPADGAAQGGNGSDVTAISLDALKANDFDVVLDGNKIESTVDAILSLLKPENIYSINIDKSQEGRKVIMITTKKNQ